MSTSSLDVGFIVLYGAFFITCLIHRWVCKSYHMQPKFNHPAVFWNPILRHLLCVGPLLVFLGIAIAAFFLTKSPWWFLLLAFATLMLTTPTVQRRSTPKNISDEANSWFAEEGVQLDSIQYSTYEEPGLARNPGAIIIVGIGLKSTSKIGFIVEVRPGQGVLAGEVIEPYGIATHHSTLALDAQVNGMPLIDLMPLVAAQHRESLLRNDED